MFAAYLYLYTVCDWNLIIHAHVCVVLAYWARLAHPLLSNLFSSTGNSGPVMIDLSDYELVYDYGDGASGEDYPADN